VNGLGSVPQNLSGDRGQFFRAASGQQQARSLRSKGQRRGCSDA